MSKLGFFHVSILPNRKIQILEKSKTSECFDDEVLLSSSLDHRQTFPGDNDCSILHTYHAVPGCLKRMAIASYPGSGNTWLRYMLESASGIFTGSRYKDLDLQVEGFWGELRAWNDGSTILQKTHDASKNHVINDFEGRGLLLIRNPYEAILSKTNFLYSGHLGSGPQSPYNKKGWDAYVAIQVQKWLDMTTNWTVHSNPSKVLVIHLEDLKLNPITMIENILSFLRLPIDNYRLKCLEKNINGYFHRNHGSNKPDYTTFSTSQRAKIDKIIDYANSILLKRGYTRLPLQTYKFYRKSDDDLVNELIQPQNSRPITKEDTLDESEKIKGLQMVAKSYVKKLNNTGSESGKILQSLINSTYSDDASSLFLGALKIWPSLKSYVEKDPIQETIDNNPGYLALEDIPLPKF